jgi:sulfopyruvate decarboxylase subunit alpha
MSFQPVQAPNDVMTAAAPWASAVCAGVHAAGSRHVVYVPDNPLSHVLRVLAETYPGIRTTVATREEEAFGIAAGLYVGGVLPTVMLQSSGLGNSLNALTSLLIPYRIPVLTVISMRGEPGEWNAAQMPMGQAVGAILDAIGIPHETLADADAAEDLVRRAGESAFATRLPRACLLSRRMTVPVEKPDHEARKR